MTLPAAFSTLLAERGMPMMDAFGTADVALSAEDAMAAAESLSGGGVAILGGDVYYKTRHGFELAFANWHSDPKAGEVPQAYVARTVQETCDYIRRYQAPPNKTPLFSLVVAEVL